jgi:hypothetical protein
VGGMLSPIARRSLMLTSITHSPLISPIIQVVVGPKERLFAAEEDILFRSSYFAAACPGTFSDESRRLYLPDEEPEIFSAILEFLYVSHAIYFFYVSP